MNEVVTAPTLTSVIGLTMREFSRRTVTEQTRLTAQLEALVAIAIQGMPAADRIVLSGPEGIALVVLGSPTDVLTLAERLQAGAADLPLCIGINYGAIKMTSADGRPSQFVGDGIVASMTLANVATRGRFLVSRAFHEALALDAPHKAEELSSVGAFTDSNVRTHELYTINPEAAARRRRRLLLVGSLTAIAIIGLGVAARAIRGAGAKQPAFLQFDIKPHGEIVIDGELKGKSPPLKRLEVTAGTHTIEIRNSSYPPLLVEINLRPEEEMTISHSFAQAKKKKEEGFIKGLRREMGL